MNPDRTFALPNSAMEPTGAMLPTDGERQWAGGSSPAGRNQEVVSRFWLKYG
jgi:hypothetical protein